jgi:hypothetical protein
MLANIAAARTRACTALRGYTENLPENRQRRPLKLLHYFGSELLSNKRVLFV